MTHSDDAAPNFVTACLFGLKPEPFGKEATIVHPMIDDAMTAVT